MTDTTSVIIVSPDATSITIGTDATTITLSSDATTFVSTGLTGPQGPIQGVATFVQTTLPVADTFVWWDTSGGNLSLWIEDGT